jgi:2-polyprenyl-3-methyl-5-hydroxy-6-metoxy-1,4-benzoquinol methylase
VIVCPRCSAGLEETGGGFVCRSCSYSAAREDGIVIFEPGVMPDHDDYQAEGLDALYRFESGHPWFTHRVKLIRETFAAHVQRDERILEVGAGTGHTARALIEAGFANLSIGEIHRNGLLYARKYGLESLYQFDLRHAPFREHFDVVALFDVLEHIHEDETAARNIHSMLRPGGRIILTVPAHQWLWSRVDELSSHYRRYNRRSMTALLAAAGFDILDCRYFFTALVPGLVARKFMARNTTAENLGEGCGTEMSRFGKMLISLATGPGDRLLLPFRRWIGGSMIAVARKR